MIEHTAIWMSFFVLEIPGYKKKLQRDIHSLWGFFSLPCMSLLHLTNAFVLFEPMCLYILLILLAISFHVQMFIFEGNYIIKHCAWVNESISGWNFPINSVSFFHLAAFLTMNTCNIEVEHTHTHTHLLTLYHLFTWFCLLHLQLSKTHSHTEAKWNYHYFRMVTGLIAIYLGHAACFRTSFMCFTQFRSHILIFHGHFCG